MTEKEFKLIQSCFYQAHSYSINGRIYIDRDNALSFIETMLDKVEKSDLVEELKGKYSHLKFSSNDLNKAEKADSSKEKK